MKKLKITILLLLCIAVYAFYTVYSTGFFRTIDSYFDGKVLTEIAVKGAEDITISQSDSFAIISATDRQIYPPKQEEKGNLYFVDLNSKAFSPELLTSDLDFPFAPHGISMLKQDSTYLIMAINHTSNEHSIEVFELFNNELKYIRTIKHPSMVSPNDLVIIDKDKYYFTNDHKYTEGIGKLAEDYLGMALANVVYYDGNEFRSVADNISYANGINFDRKRNLLYVTSPRHFLVKVFSVKKDGSLSFIEDIPCGTGVDNIELDTNGNLWIGAHPNLLRFKAYSKGNKPITPSEIIKIVYRGKGDYSVEQIYLNDGSEMSGSTVAAPWENLILTGNLMDEHILVLENNK